MNPYLGSNTATGPVVFDFVKGTVEPPVVRLEQTVAPWPRSVPPSRPQRPITPVPWPVAAWAFVLFAAACVGFGLGLLITRR